MRENRTSGSEGGEAQTNELSLPLSLCRLPHCARLSDRCRVDDPPWSEQGSSRHGGRSHSLPAPTLCRLPHSNPWNLGTLEPSREGSGQQFVDNLAVDVGEAEVAALKAIGQAGVVEAQQVENGGV